MTSQKGKTLKRLIIGAIALASLTGCTRVIEVQATVPATTEATRSTVVSTPTEKPQSTRRQFIAGVNSLVDLPYGMDEQIMWDAGVAICSMAEDGLTADEISTELMIIAEFDEAAMEVFAAVAASAITFICPEYGYLFDDLSGY
jgi:dihydropteroate synthase